MFFRRRKREADVSPREHLMKILQEPDVDEAKATQLFLQADAELVRNTAEFDLINAVRARFHEEIGKASQGKVWFKISFERFLISLKATEHFEKELVKLDAFMSLYWYLCVQYPIFMAPVKQMCREQMDPRVRRYYEKTYNIDIFTGEIYDIEVEKNNAWKEHFYKASFAFHEGRGNLELSIKEWRAFMKEFANHLAERPRLVYDFAKEVVSYQKLFDFLSYAVQIEGRNQRRQHAHDEIKAIDALIKKMIHAVYAVDEEHGMLLKRLYA